MFFASPSPEAPKWLGLGLQVSIWWASENEGTPFEVKVFKLGSTVSFWKTPRFNNLGFQALGPTWVVVKIVLPFWVPNIVRHLLFRVPKKGP